MARFSGRKKGFTLIEILVIITIIAVLAAILFPVFAQAKAAARKATSLSNARQVGMAIMMYVTDVEAYPHMSSPSNTNPRIRWPDRIYPYIKNEDIFLAPMAPLEIFGKPWAHNINKKYGGYGYNYQYLGNSREEAGNPRLPFEATDSMIAASAETIVIADTNGVRRDNNSVSGGEYTIDPPLTSARGSGKPSGFYGDGAECGTGIGYGRWGCRSTPAERHAKFVTVAFADGHSKMLKLSRMDDFNGDGRPDNGFWNGLGDAEGR